MNLKKLYEWCQYPYENLPDPLCTKVPYRIMKNSEEMGQLMAKELFDEIVDLHNKTKTLRFIIPCGPKCWYKPFTNLVNTNKLNLDNLVIYHMDECLDWQGKLLPENHPYNFKTFMLKHFYNEVDEYLRIPEQNRKWLTPNNFKEISNEILKNEIHFALGGWGQDGHIAYNQTRRNIFSAISVDDLKNSTARMQDNNLDTILALAQRQLGGAYQFSPPMSVTLGLKEILKAKKIRLFSDTGSWKQTAFRVALFSEIDVEYPLTLLQDHTDAIITATIETAQHPISINPDWNFFHA